MGQAVACAPVTQRAGFDPRLGQVFWVRFFRGFSSTVRQMSGSFRPPRSPTIIWPSFSSSIIIHYGRQSPEILTCPKTNNKINKYPQLVSNTRSGRGMRCDEAPCDRSVSTKRAGRPSLSHHHKGWWNETKWMRWVWRNGGMKFLVGENGRNPEKNLPRPRFVHHETHMKWPRRELGTPAVGGERLTACATRPPKPIIYMFFSKKFSSVHRFQKAYDSVNRALRVITSSLNSISPRN